MTKGPNAGSQLDQVRSSTLDLCSSSCSGGGEESVRTELAAAPL